MPFIVSIQISPRQKLFFRKEEQDVILLTPTRAEATPFSEDEADQLALAHALYAAIPAMVEGIKDQAA